MKVDPKFLGIQPFTTFPPTSMGLQLAGCDEALLVASREGTEFMMGIDEAGRGPTLGPMVYGSAFCAVEDEHRIRSMGFNDSKQLTEAKRDKLWEELQTCGFLGWQIRVLEAAEISEGMLRKHAKYNLNAMSHDTAIGLVRKVLDLGINLKYLYVDTVGDEGRYKAKLEGLFPSLFITVEKKADSKFPIVSAASICAKVSGGWRGLVGACVASTVTLPRPLTFRGWSEPPIHCARRSRGT